MRHLPLLLFLTFAPMLPAQTVPELTATLAAALTLDDEAIGDGGEKSATYRAFEQLRSKASREELLARLDHENPIVRAYAALALADRKEKVDWLALLRAHAADAEKVMTFRGCVKAEELCGDVLVELAREQKLLDDKGWLDLAETLVTKKSPLAAREWCLRTLTFREPMQPALRELAKAGDGPAHIAMARAGNVKDLPLLVAHLQRDAVFADDTALLAAQVFPHASLLPSLLALDGKAREQMAAGRAQRLRNWLAAIAAQRSAPAADFLAGFLKARELPRPQRRELLNLMKAAIVPFPDDAVFAPVREELVRQSRV